MCDFSNADIFLRSALYSATTCYELGQLHQLLMSQEDAGKRGNNLHLQKSRRLKRVRQNTQAYKNDPQEILAFTAVANK